LIPAPKPVESPKAPGPDGAAPQIQINQAIGPGAPAGLPAASQVVGSPAPPAAVNVPQAGTFFSGADDDLARAVIEKNLGYAPGTLRPARNLPQAGAIAAPGAGVNIQVNSPQGVPVSPADKGWFRKCADKLRRKSSSTTNVLSGGTVENLEPPPPLPAAHRQIITDVTRSIAPVTGNP